MYNYKTHTYDSEKNGKLLKQIHTEEDRIVDLKNANNDKKIRKTTQKRQNTTKNKTEEVKNEKN